MNEGYKTGKFPNADFSILSKIYNIPYNCIP